MYKLKQPDKFTAKLTANVISGRPYLWDDMNIEFENLNEAEKMALELSADDDHTTIGIFDDNENMVSQCRIGIETYRNLNAKCF